MAELIFFLLFKYKQIESQYFNKLKDFFSIIIDIDVFVKKVNF